MKTLFFSLFLVFVSGCQKFHEIQVKFENNKLVFYNDEIKNTCTKGIIISDFDVQYIGKHSGAVAWKLVRKFDTIFNASSYDLPLVYGDTIENIDTVTSAIKLTEGKYNFGGTLSCKKKSENKSITINGSFVIDKDGKIAKGTS